jgi:uncharacterized protein YraI
MNSSESIATRFLRSLFAALACIFAAVAADAKEPGEEFRPIITIAQTNLRKGPRTDSEILTLIPKGTTVAVGDCGAYYRNNVIGGPGAFVMVAE